MSPFGDQNIPPQLSEPGTARSSNRTSERIQSFPRLMYATDRPSSEIRGDSKASASRSGADMAIRSGSVRTAPASPILSDTIHVATAPTTKAPATAHGQRRWSRRAGACAGWASPARIAGIRPLSSSRRTRASPMSRSRLRASLRRQRSSSSRTRDGVSAGRRSQSGSFWSTAAIRSENVSPSNAGRRARHS